MTKKNNTVHTWVDAETGTQTCVHCGMSRTFPECRHVWEPMCVNCGMGKEDFEKTKVPNEEGTRYDWREELRQNGHVDPAHSWYPQGKYIDIDTAIGICEKALDAQKKNTKRRLQNWKRK